MPSRNTQLVKSALLPAAYVVLIVAMNIVLHRDPPVLDAAFASYGMNSKSELLTEAVLGACEMAFLVLVLRPWSYARSWIRATIAAFVFASWALAAGVAGMQAGSVYATHTLWRLTLSAALLVLAVVSGVSAARKVR